MKYLLKAITTNNRDLKTSIILQFEERHYLFNCPDGFQRMALNQKMKFNKVRYVFLSSMHPDQYSGFPGFYLSSREAANDVSQFKIGVVGPKSLQKTLLNSISFIGGLRSIEVFEYGALNKYLTEVGNYNFISKPYVSKDKMNKITKNQVVEEEKSTEESKSSDETSNFFEDEFLKVIPVESKSLIERSIESYSFICIPKQGPGKFQPKIAQDLGCLPKTHFRILQDGQSVTL